MKALINGEMVKIIDINIITGSLTYLREYDTCSYGGYIDRLMEDGCEVYPESKHIDKLLKLAKIMGVSACCDEGDSNEIL